VTVSLSRTRVQQLLDGFTGKKVIVVGDLMLDEFVWGKVRRISPEAPVPVVDVVDQTYRLGGSGNVAANIHALGGVPVPIGVIGRDWAADRVLDLLAQAGIDPAGIIRDDRPTTLKTRIIAHNQQVVRADRESRATVSDSLNRDLADAFRTSLPSASAIVVSDYDKGVVNRALLAEILPEARKAAVPVFLDPKVQHADYYRPVTMITPNHSEAELLAGIRIENESSLEEAGRRILQKLSCDYVLITRGEEGMSLFSSAGSRHLPAFAREVFDVTGAGDTVIAMLSLAHAGGASIEEASILANHAAGVAVGKIGTATVSRLELLDDSNFRNAHPAG
jgi:rfaE bifunctional protein kinase chain/domain